MRNPSDVSAGENGQRLRRFEEDPMASHGIASRGLSPAQLAAAERVVRAHADRLIARLRSDHFNDSERRQ